MGCGCEGLCRKWGAPLDCARAGMEVSKETGRCGGVRNLTPRCEYRLTPASRIGAQEGGGSWAWWLWHGVGGQYTDRIPTLFPWEPTSTPPGLGLPS